MKLTARIVNEYATENNLTIVEINGWCPIDDPGAGDKLNFGSLIKLGENVGRRGVNYRVYQTDRYLLVDEIHGVPAEPVDLDTVAKIYCNASDFNAITAREDARQSIDYFIDKLNGFEWIEHRFFEFEHLRPRDSEEARINATMFFRRIAAWYDPNIDADLQDAEDKKLARIVDAMFERDQITEKQHESIMKFLTDLYSGTSDVQHVIQEITFHYNEKTSYNAYTDHFKTEQEYLHCLKEDNTLNDDQFQTCMYFLHKLYADV